MKLGLMEESDRECLAARFLEHEGRIAEAEESYLSNHHAPPFAPFLPSLLYLFLPSLISLSPSCPSFHSPSTPHSSLLPFLSAFPLQPLSSPLLFFLTPRLPPSLPLNPTPCTVSHYREEPDARTQPPQTLKPKPYNVAPAAIVKNQMHAHNHHKP
jgi:hypothetical protein